jgi:hypothetical protein
MFWCPSPTCQAGQIHDSGSQQPIVTCSGCRQRFCFRHSVPWHESMCCDEYDAYVADPLGFRSQFERANERAEREQEEESRRRRELEDADRRFAQSLVEEEERAEAQRQAEAERVAREQQERRERERREAERKAAEEAKRQRARELERIHRQEQATVQTISRTTKNCPGCSSPIEKNAGWCVQLITRSQDFTDSEHADFSDHMTCESFHFFIPCPLPCFNCLRPTLRYVPSTRGSGGCVIAA